MTFADVMRSIWGVLLFGVGGVAFANHLLVLRMDRKMTDTPHSWWVHADTILLITGCFGVGAYLLYAGAPGRMLRGLGVAPAAEDE